MKVYKDEHDLCIVLHTFLGVDTLYFNVAGNMIFNIIRENLSSGYDINCTPDMKIRNLTKKFVSRFDKLTYIYYMQQPRPMIESKMIKHIKYMSEEEKVFIYNLLSDKHKLSLI